MAKIGNEQFDLTELPNPAKRMILELVNEVESLTRWKARRLKKAYRKVKHIRIEFTDLMECLYPIDLIETPLLNKMKE